MYPKWKERSSDVWLVKLSPVASADPSCELQCVHWALTTHLQVWAVHTVCGCFAVSLYPSSSAESSELSITAALSEWSSSNSLSEKVQTGCWSERKHLCKCHMCRNGAFITTCSWMDLCVCRALHLWGVLLIPWRSRCLQSCCVTLWWTSHQSSFSDRDLEQMQLIWCRKIQEKQISTTGFFFFLFVLKYSYRRKVFRLRFLQLFIKELLLGVAPCCLILKLTQSHNCDRESRQVTTGTCRYIMLLCTG